MSKIKNFFKKLDYRYYLGIFVLGIVLVASVIFILRAPKTIEAAPWFNDSWTYRQQFDVYNNELSALTDFQIAISTSTLQLADLYSDGKLNSDFSDLRFMDNQGQELDYWFESATSSIHSIYVKFPNLPAQATSTLFMYYGNTSAVDDRKAGGDMFDFFDDFEGDTLNTSIWYEGSADYTYSNSELRINTYGIGLQSPLGFNLNDGYTLEGKVKYLDNSTSYSGSLNGCSSRFGKGGNSAADALSFYLRTGSNLTEYIGDGSVRGYNIVSGGVISTISNDTWYILGQKIYSDGIDILLDRIEESTHSAVTWSKDMNYIELGLNALSNNVQDTVYDWVLVRQYTDIEPTVTITSGVSEENVMGNPIAYWNFDEAYGNVAYDSTDYKNDGTIYGATWAKNGRRNGALSFDGNDYVDFPTINKDLKVLSFWVYLRDDVDKNTSAIDDYLLGSLGSGHLISFGSSAGGLNDETFTVWNENATSGAVYIKDNISHGYHNILLNYNGSSYDIWIDGRQKTTYSNTLDLYTSFNLTLGKREGVSQYFNGLIDEVRAYDFSLSVDEIKQLYNRNAGSFNYGNNKIIRSCADQLVMNPSSKSGIYTIDPGYGIDPLDVYCDMETDGGGWTRVMWNNATGSAIAPDDIMVNFYDASDYGSINPERISRMLDSQDVMLKQVTQVDAWPNSWSYLIAEDIGNWDYDQPLCTGSLLGHTGRNAGCSGHAANDNYSSYDGFNIAIYTDTAGNNDDDAFVPKYTDEYYKPASSNGHIEFYIRGDASLAVTTTQGLILDMPFESQSSNTTYDESGYENDGSITGATWKTSVNCKEGRCFDFDGNDYISNIGADLSSDTEASITFWINSDWDYNTGHGSYQSLIVQQKDWNDLFGLVQNASGSLAFSQRSGGSSADINVVTVNMENYRNQWVHVAAIYDEGNYKIYLNGNLAGEDDGSFSSITSAISGYNFAIANNIYSDRFFCKSLIDQVKIFNVALTQREIMEEMNSGKLNPVLNIDFNEGGGVTAYDKSGQDNDGTILSNASWELGENCVSGNCVHIDGTDSDLNSIQVSEDDSLDAVSSLSVSLWIKIDSLKNHQIIYKRQEDGIPQDFSYMLYVSSDNILDFRVSNVSGTVGYAYYYKPLILSTWYHVVGVYNGSEVKIYVDGSAEGNTPGALTGDVLDSNSYLQIGGSDGIAMMDGYIDELKIYPYTLTGREIKEEYVQSRGQFGQTSVMNNNTMVLSLDYDNLGNQMTNPGLSCLDILNRRTETPADGIYWIDPDGGVLNGFQVYCDMTDNGGGWTLILHAVGGSSLSGYATVSSYNLDQSTNPNGTTFKFSDAVINSLASGSDPVYRVNTFGTYENTRFWDASATYGHTTECAGTNKYSYSDVDLTTDQHGGNSGGDMGICDYNGSGLYFQAKSDPISSTNWYTGPGNSYTAVTTGSSPNENALMWIRSDIDVDSVPVPELPVVSSIATSSPILDMNFDQYSGGVYLDKSGNGNNGSPSGNPEWKKSVYCKKGRCLNFDGEDDYVDCGTSSVFNFGTDDFTLSTWVYQKSQTVGEQDFISKYVSGTGIVLGVWSTNKVFFHIAGSTNADWIGLELNKWTHIVAVRKDGIKYLYVDGNLVSSISGSNNVTCANPLTLAQRSDGIYNFDGLIDEAKIYDRALTQTEISELYNGGAPIGWWRLDEGVDDLCSDGADVCDNSGEGNNGTINGDPTWITDTFACKQGGCMDFDGVEDYIQFSSGLYSNMLDEGTITAWARTDTHAVRMEVINLGGYVILNLMSGKWQAIAYDAVSVDFLEGSNVVDGEWTNLILTWTGLESKFYIDGKEIANDVTSGSPLDTGSIAIGAQPGNHGNKFDGKIDDVRIYNYALSEDQIKEVYNGGLVKFK